MGTFSSETSANKYSGKFETLMALQNDPRWLLMHSWFSKCPRGWPPDHPTRTDTRGHFGSHYFIQPLCHADIPTPTPITILIAKHVVICWASVYDNLWFCDPTGFICSLRVELPLPPPFSPIFILLLLLGYGYCYVKVDLSLQGFFLCVFFFFFLFCWRR